MPFHCRSLKYFVFLNYYSVLLCLCSQLRMRLFSNVHVAFFIQLEMSPFAFLLLSIIWILSFYIKQKSKDLLINVLANSLSFLHQFKNPFIMFCGNYLTCMNRCSTFYFLLSWVILLAWYLVILRSKFSHFQRFSITPSIWIMRQSFLRIILHVSFDFWSPV